MLHAVLASLALGAVMTLGDFVWAFFDVRHSVVKGVIHGAAMCLCVGVAIGMRARKPALAAIAGLAIGVVAAGTFYALAPWLRWGAMFPAWFLLWLLFAALQRGLARDETGGTTMKRGLLAALLSGFAFYLISDIWIHEAAHPGMLEHFGAWVFAFAPAFFVLFVRTPGSG